jgi:hypothetical protein
MPIAALEDSLRDANSEGAFIMPYPPELDHKIRKSLNWGDDIRIRLNSLDCANILHAVMNILLDWTLAMETQGILGENLTFSPEERERSAFVQNAENSVVQGGHRFFPEP